MKLVQVAVGVLKNAHGEVLISLRHQALHQGGLWEFPGGKIEAGETAEQALVREFKEELDIIVLASTPLITVIHQYPDLAVQLNVFSIEHFSGEARSCEGQPFKWVNPDELTQYQFPAANQAIITAAQLPPYYAILDDANESLLLNNLQKILDRGVKLIQARLKILSHDSTKAFLEQAYPLCKQYGALLLMNSAVENAEKLAVDGIHLTSSHLMACTKRPELPGGTGQWRTWIAASCHNLEELQHAQRMGVDFVVLAPVLSTKTHPGTKPLGWQRFAQLVAKVNLPVYALGGLSEPDLMMALQAGGQGISAIRAFLD